jgi:UDP-N-acetylmuramate dehydrogenase
MNMHIQERVPLAPHTTFQIGGSAAYFAEVTTEDELRAALAWAQEKELSFSILGGGSNVLASDEGFDGLVIRIVSDGMQRDGNLLTIDAGRNLLETIRDAAAQGLSGWEKLAGIPGTVGGAARGNAGAFGSEMKDVVTAVRALNTETGEINNFSNAECAFAYRQSYFKRHPQWIITLVQVRLAHAENEKIIESIDATITEREKRHLQNVRAAGSYFMNPVAPAHIVALFEQEKGVQSRENRVPAGWLIEKAGFKGAMFGGAQASMQHPNYLVNASGSATSAEVLELADTIKEAVREQFGVELQEEAAFLE